LLEHDSAPGAFPDGLRLEVLAMTIWVDADACPGEIRDILYRAADRVEAPMVFVANRPLRVPVSAWISTVQVPAGLDVADQEIVDTVAAGDLVVTSDIPLAALAIKKGATALSPRGVLHTEVNIGQRLAMRNLLTDMRNVGMITGGPRGLDSRDRQAFANELDKFLTKAVKKRAGRGA